MIPIPDVRKRPIGVFGLGVSGIATCEALAASGAMVYAWDENVAAREKTSDTEYRAEHPKAWPWAKLASLVVSPGVPLTHPKPHAIVRKARAEKVEIIGDTELFARAVNAMPDRERPRVVAITGSNGKSTTTALIGHILKEAGEDVFVGGNIGAAVLSLPPPDRHCVYALELSSFQLDLTDTLRADAAVFLNLSPDHIERHGSVDGYLAAKARIFRNQREEDAAIIGVDDAYGEALCTRLTAARRQRVIPVSAEATLGRGVYVLDGAIFTNLDGKAAKAGDAAAARALPGAHNHQNIAAAVAACRHLGVAPALAMKAAEKFQGLPHRLEEVARIGKAILVNDSKATNAAAAARALAAFDDIYWIAGGRAKEGGVSSLAPAALAPVRKAYLIGEAAAEFEATLKDEVECAPCDDLEKAVRAALADALASDAPAPVILLSPACASYDQYKDFNARGEHFRTLAGALQVEEGEAA